MERFNRIITMREIEFRGKDCHGHWRYGALVKFEGLQAAIYYPIRHPKNNHYIMRADWCYVDEDTVGQYTGLKDKKKTKIYEGDVIRYGEQNFLISSSRFAIPLFVAIACEQKKGEHYFVELWEIRRDKKRIRVIGNRYDNPELLNFQKKDKV